MSASITTRAEFIAKTVKNAKARIAKLIEKETGEELGGYIEFSAKELATRLADLQGWTDELDLTENIPTERTDDDKPEDDRVYEEPTIEDLVGADDRPTTNDDYRSYEEILLFSDPAEMIIETLFVLAGQMDRLLTQEENDRALIAEAEAAEEAMIDQMTAEDEAGQEPTRTTPDEETGNPTIVGEDGEEYELDREEEYNDDEGEGLTEKEQEIIVLLDILKTAKLKSTKKNVRAKLRRMGYYVSKV